MTRQNNAEGGNFVPSKIKVFERYKDLDLATFAALVKSFAGYDENAWSEVEGAPGETDKPSSFARRLVTGLADETGLPRGVACDYDKCAWVVTAGIAAGHGQPPGL
jgi:hypothetical protein